MRCLPKATNDNLWLIFIGKNPICHGTIRAVARGATVEITKARGVRDQKSQMVAVMVVGVRTHPIWTKCCVKAKKIWKDFCPAVSAAVNWSYWAWSFLPRFGSRLVSIGSIPTNKACSFCLVNLFLLPDRACIGTSQHPSVMFLRLKWPTFVRSKLAQRVQQRVRNVQPLVKAWCWPVIKISLMLNLRYCGM